MSDFIKRLLGLGKGSTPPAKPRVPAAELAAFKEWYLAQRKPAVALVRDPDLPIAATGSRIGGPAWLAEGEPWPTGADGMPLDFLAQLDLADCAPLDGYPPQGVVQFFIGRDDLFGADLDHPLGGNVLVRCVLPGAAGRLHPQPPLEEPENTPFNEPSQFETVNPRENGLGLRPEPFVDRIDWSTNETRQRLNALAERYDVGPVEDFLDSQANERMMGNHTGGYPVFTQSDSRTTPDLVQFDHVLLHLSSAEDDFHWGDTGEAVFMIRSDDLRRGDFSRVLYSWDCA